MTAIRLIFLSLLLVFAIAKASDQSDIREIPPPPGMHLAGAEDPSAIKVYIVQLKAPSAAEYHLATRPKGYAAPLGTSKAALRLDPTSARIQNHTRQLAAEQDDVLARLGGGSQKIYSYRYSLNGFAARMTPAQADKLRGDDRVLKVWEDEIRPLATRTSPTFLKLFDSERGLRRNLDGDGIVIGVIDSGITPNHPALKDTREADRPRICESSWAQSSLIGLWLCRRFDVREDQLVFDPPEDWQGVCESGDGFTEENCNNKLIGARIFAEGAQSTLPIDSSDPFSPADVYGHGTHVATIAAGNKVNASIFGTMLGRVQGMAPGARVAVYKACWIRTGEIASTCNTSDLANAIDSAVADGVDVINYSVGSSLIDAIAPDDIALINAAKAGVLSVVAAGNEGPNLATIGSPAGNPAVITVAASSRDGSHSLEAMQITAPSSVAGRYAVKEASFTPALQDNDPIEQELILVDDDDDTLDDGSAGTTYDGCEALVNGSEVSGKIAFIQRGGCAFDIKVQNAADAGAVAAVVYNIAGDPIVMTGDAGLSDIPALMIGQADGMMLFDEIDSGNIVEAVLDKGLLLDENDDGNVMAQFSARGPGPVNDILKPDVTAPGINILAGETPESIVSIPGEQFAFRSGTSMATPHVAGVAALLMQAHPEWSPAAVKSALMTTAYQDVVQQDGESPAHPFDFGSGHVAPNDANDPGLVYELNDDDYDAYSCGVQSPAIDPARCQELQNGGRSLNPADMNLASISISRLASQRTVSRRVTNVSDSAETYVAEAIAPAGFNIQVSPSTITIAPGATASYDVTLTHVSGSLDLWRFGSLTWRGTDHVVRSPIAVRPTSVTAPTEVSSFGGTGSLSFPVEFGYSGSYTPRVHGLKRATIVDGFVDQDPSKTFSFRTNNGVSAHFFNVSANQAYVRFWLRDEFTDGDDDLDMYVYFSPDGSAGSFTRIGESGEFNSDEEFSLFNPAQGVYGIFVHGFETDSTDPGGPGANYQLLVWEFGFNDDVGNMTASGPGFVNAGTSADVTINWSNLGSQSIYLGGISHNTPQGLVGMTIVRVRN